MLGLTPGIFIPNTISLFVQFNQIQKWAVIFVDDPILMGIRRKPLEHTYYIIYSMGSALNSCLR